jgi:hypothetical protein
MPGDPIKEIPQRQMVRSAGIDEMPEPRGFGVDPLAESQTRTSVGESRAFSSSGLNFAGMGFTGVNPPDPVGDVGRDYYIQMVNGSGGSQFAVYNKADGSLAAGPIVLDSMAIGSPCDSGLGDPIVLYDHLADRWFLSEFSSAGNALCVYVSMTSDPIGGGWWGYAFPMPTFPDYPKYAVWPDAYYASTHQGLNPPAAHALERPKMLAGLPATVQTLTVLALSGFGFQALTPADLDGRESPPSGAPGIFMRHYDTESHGPPGIAVDTLELYQFWVDWETPPNSTLAFNADVNVSEFDSDLCGLTSRMCFPQPGSAVLLDPLREVIMWRLVYRNFGTHESVIGSFVTDTSGNDNGGIRWFEVRRRPAGAGLRASSFWQLYQEGTYVASDLALNHWMGSVAMDGAGNIALGCNISNTKIYPGLRWDGRLSTDPLGLMTRGPTAIADGSSANPSHRYGDYSSLSLDPVDDCTFWFTGEYNPTPNWGTRIATFRFDRCPNAFEVFVGEDPSEP